MPTQNAPFEPAAQPLLTLGIMRMVAQNANADELDAHPAASDFPGTVPASAPRITRSSSINTAIPRLHSTGLYAPPGTVVTVTVPDSAIDSGLRAQVGAHSDTLWQESRWTRMPQLTRTFALDRPSVSIANEFGGPLYVVLG